MCFHFVCSFSLNFWVANPYHKISVAMGSQPYFPQRGQGSEASLQRKKQWWDTELPSEPRRGCWELSNSRIQSFLKPSIILALRVCETLWSPYNQILFDVQETCWFPILANKVLTKCTSLGNFFYRTPKTASVFISVCVCVCECISLPCGFGFLPIGKCHKMFRSKAPYRRESKMGRTLGKNVGMELCQRSPAYHCQHILGKPQERQYPKAIVATEVNYS